MSEAELVIDGHELTSCLATGNYSQVWEATPSGSGTSVAMKLLLPEALADKDQVKLFKHEINVVKQLEHPNIIRFIGSAVTKKQAYYTMEYFRGMNLKSLIRADLHSVHLRASKLMECCTQAFAYMHEKGWIHKDIKPDNILLTKGGEVRVIDFSLATKPSSSVGHMMTRKKSIAIQGTRTYIAPELIKRERLTPAADIYSLGVLFYEALAGRPPFMGGTPNELLMMHVRDQPDLPSSYHPNVHPEADALIMKMLKKRPADRHESMQEVFTEVRSLKLFRQDPEEFKRAKLAKLAAEEETSVDQRLDSRADAARVASGAPAPKKPAPKPQSKPAAEKPAAAPTPQAPSPQPAAPQQPAMPQYPGQYPPMQQPMMPQQPAAQYPMQPGMMPPGQYPPGQFPPGQYPPGQYPGQYPSVIPGQPQQMPPQPGMPYPGQPVAPPQQTQAQPPANAPQQQPAAPPSPPPNEEPEQPEGIDWINIS